MSDKDIYAAINAELDKQQTDPALWTQAQAEAKGNAEITRAVYIRLRFAELKAQQRQVAVGTGSGLSLALEPVEAPAPETAPEPPASADMQMLRNRLKRELAATGKFSLYQTLGLTPDASQAAVDARIAELDQQEAAGDFHPGPEYRLAKETLGNREAREAYDYRLLESLDPAAVPALAPQRLPPAGVTTTQPALQRFEPLSATIEDTDLRRAHLIITVLALLSVVYLVLGFMRERNDYLTQVQAQAAQQRAHELAIEQERVRNARLRDEQNARLADKIIDKSAAYGERRNDLLEDESEARRQQMEYRAEMERQRLQMEQERQQQRADMEREDMENLEQAREEQRAEQEKRYWACMNKELTRTYSAEASERCAYLRL